MCLGRFQTLAEDNGKIHPDTMELRSGSWSSDLTIMNYLLQSPQNNSLRATSYSEKVRVVFIRKCLWQKKKKAFSQHTGVFLVLPTNRKTSISLSHTT